MSDAENELLPLEDALTVAPESPEEAAARAEYERQMALPDMLLVAVTEDDEKYLLAWQGPAANSELEAIGVRGFGVEWGPDDVPDELPAGLYVWEGKGRWVPDGGWENPTESYALDWDGAYRPATAADLAHFEFAAPAAVVERAQ